MQILEMNFFFFRSKVVEREKKGKAETNFFYLNRRAFCTLIGVEQIINEEVFWLLNAHIYLPVIEQCQTLNIGQFSHFSLLD